MLAAADSELAAGYGEQGVRLRTLGSVGTRVEDSMWFIKTRAGKRLVAGKWEGGGPWTPPGARDAKSHGGEGRQSRGPYQRQVVTFHSFHLALLLVLDVFPVVASLAPPAPPRHVQSLALVL